MTPFENRLIENFNLEFGEKKIPIVLKADNSSQSEKLQEFSEMLSDLLPCVQIKNEKTDDEALLPAIVVGKSLHYHAIPLGQELEPFLTALKMSANESKSKLSAEMIQRLDGLEATASFDIFIAPGCPFCPLTVKTFIALPFASDLIRVSIIDAALFPEKASERGVRSVPAVFMDESFSWTGNVNLNEILRVLENRDPAQLSSESLKKMLSEGFAWKVAEMMVGKGMIFPNFIRLLTHHNWTVRLGAMAAVEEMVFRNRSLAVPLEKCLWESFSDFEDPVKGDMFYVLGEMGDRRTISRINSFLKGKVSSDIQEAAEDAINTILKRLA